MKKKVEEQIDDLLGGQETDPIQKVVSGYRGNQDYYINILRGLSDAAVWAAISLHEFMETHPDSAVPDPSAFMESKFDLDWISDVASTIDQMTR